MGQLMARIANFLERRFRQRVASRWTERAGQVTGMSARRLRGFRREALDLRARLDDFLSAARPRLTNMRKGAEPADRPLGADVIWRPQLWSTSISPSSVIAAEPSTRFGDTATLHHDCPLREAILRQAPDLENKTLAPFGVAIEVMGFEGSFLSLAIDLPQELITGLTRDHIIRLDLAVQQEREARIYGRLNIRHGPNTDDILREVPVVATDGMQQHQVEFDLHSSEINEKRVEGGWLDLIIERPAMNAVLLGDVVLTRYPRADM